MMQASYSDDKADLPNGLYVMRTYTELKDGSHNVSIMLRNLTAQPIHLARGWVISRVAAANAIPEAQCSPELLKQLNDESEDKPEPAKLSMQQRQDLLLTAFQKDGRLDHLKEWPLKLAKKAVALLLEFHHIFSLEPNEIGYNFEIEYVCGLDNKVADALSRVGGHLDEDAVKELLDQGAIKELLSHAVCYGMPRAETDDPRVTQEHEKVEGEIIIQARMQAEMKRNYQNLADSQWVVAQWGGQAIRLVMDWLRRRKDDNRTLDQYQYLKHLCCMPEAISST